MIYVEVVQFKNENVAKVAIFFNKKEHSVHRRFGLAFCPKHMMRYALSKAIIIVETDI